MFDFKRALSFAWAAPVTAVGLAYVTLFAHLGWYKPLGRRGDAWVWQLVPDKMPTWLTTKWARWGGQAIGNVVVVKYDLGTDRGDMTLRHEQEHVRQCMSLGVLWPVLYALASFGLRYCPYSDPYWDNPFEIDARRASGQVVDVVGAVSRAYAAGKIKPQQLRK